MDINNFLDVIGEVDERFIIASERDRTQEIKRRQRTRRILAATIAAAALLGLCAFLMLRR